MSFFPVQFVCGQIKYLNKIILRKHNENEGDEEQNDNDEVESRACKPHQFEKTTNFSTIQCRY